MLGQLSTVDAESVLVGRRFTLSSLRLATAYDVLVPRSVIRHVR